MGVRMYEQAIPFEIERFDPDARLVLAHRAVNFDVVVGFDADLGVSEGLDVERIKDTLTWVPPSEPHTGFVVRISPGPTIDPQADPIDVGNVHAINLKTLVDAAGVYSFAVAAYNAAGNEGPDGVLENVTLDWTVPGAPTGLEIIAGDQP